MYRLLTEKGEEKQAPYILYVSVLRGVGTLNRNICTIAPSELEVTDTAQNPE